MYIIEQHCSGDHDEPVISTIGLFPDVEQANQFIAAHPDEFGHSLILYDAKQPHTVRFGNEGARVGYALTVCGFHEFVSEDLSMKMWRPYDQQQVLFYVREVEYGRLEHKEDVVVTV